MRLNERTILREVERLNRRVNGGWATITAHPVFGTGRWVIQVDPITHGHGPFTIATGFGLRDMIRRAHDWIDERATVDNELQVAAYLESDEYAAWCKRTMGSKVLMKQENADA